MKTTINPAIEPMLREFKAALQGLYGSRLSGIILYGSYARGDYTDESDVDLMILLNDDQVNTYAEIRKIMDVETDFILKYGVPISPLPTSVMKYRVSTGGVYQEVRKEGIAV